VGVGSDSGYAGSTTTAGISGIAGDTAMRSTDAETGIARIFEKERVQKEIEAQTKITEAFGRNASRAIGEYAQTKYNELKDIDPEEAAKWAEGGIYRVGLHTIAGGLTGDMSGAAGAAASQSLIAGLGEQIAKLNIPLEVKQMLATAAGAAIGAAVGGEYGAASGLNATANNYLTAADLRSKHQKLKDCEAKGDPACEISVLKEYEFKNAKKTAGINYNSVLTEDALRAEKTQLESLLSDDALSDAAKTEARRSIKELETAINVIQRSPALRDAAELGLIAIDVAALGQLAAAKMLTSAVVRELVLNRTGKEITHAEAARIANNHYRDGVELPQALATSSGIVIQATPGKTTTILGSYVTDMKSIITEQSGAPKSMGYLGGKPGGFNVLNVPDDYVSSLINTNADAFWDKINRPFLDAAIERGDEIYLATRPEPSQLLRANGEKTGFGREIEYLIHNGYRYNALSGKMTRF
jgi:hypothetical protein